MQRITRDQSLTYELSGFKKPLIYVKQGESFQVETWDAASGLVTSPDDYSKVRSSEQWKSDPVKGNPVAGPVYIDGAEKGDLIEITIESIEPIEFGWTMFANDIGPLGDSIKWKDLSRGQIHIIKHLPGPSGTTRDGKGVLNDKHSWDLAPMIGTIAVAPDREIESTTMGQGPFGGNLDMRDVKEATKVYLNVYHEGGLLYIGDVHGSQGDTEYYGAADETSATVTASAKIIKNKTIPFVRLKKPDSIISVFSYRPLETAIHEAVDDLMNWLVEEYNFTAEEAYIHTCVNPDFRINVYQMVRTGSLEYTVGAEIPLKYLG